MQKRNRINGKPHSSPQEKLVQDSNDNKIDQDFSGFPNGHSTENIINPKTDAEKMTADVGHKDGEKMNKEEIEEAKSEV